MTIIWFLLGYFLRSLVTTLILWASCVAAKRGDALLLQQRALAEPLAHEPQTGVPFVVGKA